MFHYTDRAEVIMITKESSGITQRETSGKAGKIINSRAITHTSQQPALRSVVNVCSNTRRRLGCVWSEIIGLSCMCLLLCYL